MAHAVRAVTTDIEFERDSLPPLTILAVLTRLWPHHQNLVQLAWRCSSAALGQADTAGVDQIPGRTKFFLTLFGSLLVREAQTELMSQACLVMNYRRWQSMPFRRVRCRLIWPTDTLIWNRSLPHTPPTTVLLLLAVRRRK